MTNIKYLLDYCQDKAELYNRVSNRLYVNFGIKSEELSLLCTFIASEELNYEHEKGNAGPDQKMGRNKKREEINTGGCIKNNRGKQITHS